MEDKQKKLLEMNIWSKLEIKPYVKTNAETSANKILKAKDPNLIFNLKMIQSCSE
jgi:hypothetical protein